MKEIGCCEDCQFAILRMTNPALFECANERLGRGLSLEDDGVKITTLRGPAVLHFGPKFGCVHWERRDPLEERNLQ